MATNLMNLLGTRPPTIMRRHLSIFACSAPVIFLASISALLAQPGQPPASQPASTQKPSDAAPTPTSSGDPEIDNLLDGLETRGKDIKGLSAKLIYRHISTIPVESEQKKIGELHFARGEPSAKFLVHFTKVVADGVVSSNQEFYAFDGEWYVERSDAGKNVTRRQMSSGEKIDPFELGKGPFPLPFGQKRVEILRHFEVSLAKPEKGDPPGTKHLHCAPRPHSSLADKYSRVEIFVDPQRDIPIRVVTENINDKSRIEVDFNDINLGGAPAGSRFKVETPKGFHESFERAAEEPEIDLTPRPLTGGSQP
ncbi:MAG TPA: hypothetical protein VNT79_02370 [Phycisphaerae bacterium]|nr:hypothetical protein [Phycisphaerae bacterium]